MRISDWSSDVCSSDLSSDVTVYHGAVEKLKDLETRNPKIQFQLLYNNAKYAEEQYASAIDAMIEGAFLAVVVVFLFLRDWRATFISALAMPVFERYPNVHEVKKIIAARMKIETPGPDRKSTRLNSSH